MARAFRLHNAEKEFLDQILDKAAISVQTRDKKQCCLLARRAILADKNMLKLATATLRPVVLAKIKSEGDRFFIRLLERHARFLALPKPLRGKALDVTASALGLVTRVETVRVSASTDITQSFFLCVPPRVGIAFLFQRACSFVSWNEPANTLLLRVLR
jgi:hypothetical protein